MNSDDALQLVLDEIARNEQLKADIVEVGNMLDAENTAYLTTRVVEEFPDLRSWSVVRLKELVLRAVQEWRTR